MPVNRKMMGELEKEYGKKKGKKVYYALENKEKKVEYMPKRMR